MRVRKATISDVPRIHELINGFAEQQLMLARSRSEVYDLLRDHFVCEHEAQVIGCAALHIVWEDLAEVRSLAVVEPHQRQGVGRDLVKACLVEARELGVPRIFCLTYAPTFFQPFGFREVSKEALPHKVWSDCIQCPKFPNCNEVAMVLELQEETG